MYFDNRFNWSKLGLLYPQLCLFLCLCHRGLSLSLQWNDSGNRTQRKWLFVGISVQLVSITLPRVWVAMGMPLGRTGSGRHGWRQMKQRHHVIGPHCLKTTSLPRWQHNRVWCGQRICSVNSVVVRCRMWITIMSQWKVLQVIKCIIYNWLLRLKK